MVGALAPRSLLGTPFTAAASAYSGDCGRVDLHAGWQSKERPADWKLPAPVWRKITRRSGSPRPRESGRRCCQHGHP
jgi:hypothetical protein